MTIGEMERRMSYAEFQGWAVFYRFEHVKRQEAHADAELERRHRARTR